MDRIIQPSTNGRAAKAPDLGTRNGKPIEVPRLPAKVNVITNVFTYDGKMDLPVFNWCCGAGIRHAGHELIDSYAITSTVGYPTDRVRNAAAMEARDKGFHFMMMLDSDMAPDRYVGSPNHPDARPFLDAALRHAVAQPGPCIVGAPYCSAPPAQRVLVMRNRPYAPDLPDGDGQRIDGYTREEAATARGFEKVAALGTGCILIDLRVLDVVEPPWFAYEFGDPPWNTKLASTEDVVFTRNAHWFGVPQFVAWDCWAGHKKEYMVEKPSVAPCDSVPEAVWTAIHRGWRPPAVFGQGPDNPRLAAAGSLPPEEEFNRNRAQTRLPAAIGAAAQD